MRNPHDPRVLPMRAGVAPSCVVAPSQGRGLLLDFLAQRLPAVARSDWLRRMAQGEVVDELGQPTSADTALEPGRRYYYYRELACELELPFQERVLHQDAHLLVADKPHFLPVVPSGPYLQQTLLVRLRRKLGLRELSPLHRIDRETAGLVLFSVQRQTRGRYQALFRDGLIAKHYQATAPWRPDQPLPEVYSSCLQDHPEQFFRMSEVPGGPANAHTRLALLAHHGRWARYHLQPMTGKRHQLRVQMAALGLPLLGDMFYPQAQAQRPGDYSNPLQLLACTLAFTDPISGQPRRFDSQLQLRPLVELAGEAWGC